MNIDHPFSDEYALVPAVTRENILAYIQHGQPCGGFLTAVLENDLGGAVSRADLENQRALVQIVRWLYNNAPCGCYGSPEKVEAWQKQKGLKGVL